MSESSPSGASPHEPPAEPRLPERDRRRFTSWLVPVGVVAVVALVVGVLLTVPGGSDDKRTVRIGVVDASQPYWKTYAELAEKRHGVTVELVNFSDYSQPNRALRAGQLDLNQFQHIQYLADYNVTAHDDLQPIGATAVYPLPLYSLKYDKPAELPTNAKVAVPNDAINEARGLLVLQAAGLLTLRDGGTAFSSTADITSRRVEVVTLDASQTARAVQNGSVAAAIVNNDFATSAKLPTSRAIFQDDPSSDIAAPYVNVFVARKADVDNPTYRELAKLYHDPAVRKGVRRANNDTAVFRELPAAELRELLRTVQQQAQDAQ